MLVVYVSSLLEKLIVDVINIVRWYHERERESITIIQHSLMILGICIRRWERRDSGRRNPRTRCSKGKKNKRLELCKVY